MTNHERIKDIEAIVRRSSPCVNESALQAIRDHVAALRGAADSGYMREKLTGIESWAGVYFSERKPQQYSDGGAELAGWILADCRAVANLLPSDS